MKGNNPFENALKGFKAEKKFTPEDGEEFDGEGEPQSKALVEPEVSNTDKKKEQETAEDEALFSELTKVLGLKKSDPFYYKIRNRVIFDSRTVDVTYDVNRFLRWRVDESKNERAQEIVKMVLKRGYRAAAVNWIKSMTPEGMKYGKGSRQLRLENAEKFAKLAGVSLESLIKENDLKVDIG